MKKFIVVLLGLGLIAPSFAFAQTTPANIQALLDQIKALQAQIQQLQQQQQQVRQQEQAAIAQLVSTMGQGATGDNVTILQTLLAADPGIYPEGTISGYYGSLTAAAVKRFQKQNGLEQVGNVGPKTLKLLNKMLGTTHQLGWQSNASAPAPASTSSTSTVGGVRRGEIDDRDGGEGERHGQPCAIVPPGHLIAPGWLRKHNDERPIVPPCQTLPPGIWYNNRGTTTPDTIAPVISGLAVGSITQTTATVSWTTNELATSKVYIGAVNPVVPSPSNLQQISGYALLHNVGLTGLTANTAYYLVVVSTDMSGNTATSSQTSFTTSAIADVTPPVITNLSAGSLGNTSATMTWTTDENATTNVYFGTVNPVVPSPSNLQTIAGLSTSHSVPLTGLATNTTYYLVAVSADASGNTATSSQISFATTNDVTGPVVSSATVSSIATTSATVSWTTNENATGRVYYSTATPVNLGTALTMSDAALTTNHSFNLSGLTASTTYYFVLESKDQYGNTTQTPEANFATTN